MKLSLIVIVTFLALLAAEIKGKLDFSQFYLPPCCYTPPQDTFTGYASPSEKVNVNAKREVSLKHYSNNFKNLSIQIETPTSRVHTLIIPIENLVKSKPNLSLTKYETKKIGEILVPEISNKKNVNSSAETTLLDNISQDIETASTITRGSIRKKSLSSKDQETSKLFNNKNVMSKRVGLWESKRINNRSRLFQDAEASNNDVISNHNQVAKKIPKSWVKYLKRALYQSITNGKGMISEKNNEFIDHREEGEIFKIRFPKIWKSIKTAQVEFVDKMSQVSHSPTSPIYLPLSEGPVISGILVNSHDGNLHLRVVSELYLVNPERGLSSPDNCQCYLFGPGEILIAYWSVSRIFKANGHPALQYLVHPLPHSVPTPPEFLPFSNEGDFLPSPVDPLTRLYEIMHRHPILLTKSASESTRNPKLVHQESASNVGNHHQDDDAATMNNGFYHNPPQEPSINLLQDPIPQALPVISGPRNPVLNNGPQFLSNAPQISPQQFQQQQQFNIALQNYYNQQQFQNPNNIYQSIPYADLNVNGPINYEIPFQLPLTSPHPSQQALPPLNLEINNVQHQPSPVIPLQEAETPLSQNPTTFPKSIQDILSPEEITPPPQPSPISTPVQEQIIPTGQPFPVLPSPQPSPFLINYPTNFPHYLNYNFLNQGNMFENNNNLGNQQQRPHNMGTKTKSKPKVKNKPYQQLDTDKCKQHEQNDRPYVVSNILDNERKYYPIRQQSHKNRVYENYRVGKRSSFSKRKIVQDINNKGGYILDF